MENLSLLERLANPDLLASMTISEKLIASCYVAALGMIITFIALMILWGLIVIMTRLLNSGKVEKDVKVSSVKSASDIEEEVIAVISAAVAMYYGPKKMGIKDIVRIR